MLEYKVKETVKNIFLLEHEFETRNGDFGFIRPLNELMVICDTLTISVIFFYFRVYSDTWSIAHREPIVFDVFFVFT